MTDKLWKAADSLFNLDSENSFSSEVAAYIYDLIFIISIVSLTFFAPSLIHYLQRLVFIICDVSILFRNMFHLHHVFHCGCRRPHPRVSTSLPLHRKRKENKRRRRQPWDRRHQPNVFRARKRSQMFPNLIHPMT